MKGLISNIQRFSLNDGPGIRTTVFFKGCNLHCAWCHNPESIEGLRPQIMYYPDKCIGCYKCTTACLCKAHKKIDGKHYFYPDLCVRCGRCASVCFAGALEKVGERYTEDDVMKEILQDKAYYLDSHGGVTFSGGEVMCQKEFALSLANCCKNEGIEVAIETSLSFQYEYMKDLIDSTALVMCDMKIFDDSEHIKWTGAGNELIKKNIAMLDKDNKPFIVRTPLIPNATDSIENIKAIGEFVAPLKNIIRWELLNYNPLGNSKYDALGVITPFRDSKPLGKHKLDELIAVAKESSGKTVKLG